MFKKKIKKISYLKVFTILLLQSLLYSQIAIGDTVFNLQLPICANSDPDIQEQQYFDINDYNGFSESTISPRVILLAIFTSWCAYCQTEAFLLEDLHEEYIDDGLLVLSAGGDWGFPYDCSGWANSFNLTHPILNFMTTNVESWEDAHLINYLGVGIVPHAVVIDHRNILSSTIVGYNPNVLNQAVESALETMAQDLDGDGVLFDDDNCPSIHNPEQIDIDNDNLGDECDLCDNLNNFVIGNLNGTLDQFQQATIDIFDLLLLTDFLDNSYENNVCSNAVSDINGDNSIDLIDVFTLAYIISEQN